MLIYIKNLLIAITRKDHRLKHWKQVFATDVNCSEWRFMVYQMLCD